MSGNVIPDFMSGIAFPDIGTTWKKSGNAFPDIMLGNFFPDIGIFSVKNANVGIKFTRHYVGNFFSRHWHFLFKKWRCREKILPTLCWENFFPTLAFFGWKMPMSGEKYPDIMSGNFFPDIGIFRWKNANVGGKISRHYVGKIFSRHRDFPYRKSRCREKNYPTLCREIFYPTFNVGSSARVPLRVHLHWQKSQNGVEWKSHFLGFLKSGSIFIVKSLWNTFYLNSKHLFSSNSKWLNLDRGTR